MKKCMIGLFFSLCATALLAQSTPTAAASSTSVVASKVAAFNWNVTSFDFGKIALNKPVTHEFKFTNSGTDALIIASVQASCGCTVAEYTKEPIAPGGQGFVKATYNAAHAGVFNKTITVNANTGGGAVVLNISGEVMP
ncbi:DUF1573 domain-containing protein [Chryseolinea soli]|uniref:DUF1573 domain-containing protein n=1 Tax=Chryseolinea soli TaxID=2321403 RepID=A0A385SL73_9BACT|nr:DUF1573 domain-containing protein [Chryseolinea soli]AYB31121.1 DUF1573 domain-containing protein [Chryseolinea soli]